MLSIEQKEELYRFLCKKINYGVHPINNIAQLLADNHISSRNYGYGRLKNMLRDMPEFITLLPPENGSEEMRVRFAIWQRPKTTKTKPPAKAKTKTVVLAGKTRRTRATAIPKTSGNQATHHTVVPKLPEPPESLLAHTQLDSHMLHILSLKTGRVQASLPGLLESSYQQAKASGALDYTKDKLGFRLDVPAKNGRPIYLTFKRPPKTGKHLSPYALIYIDDNDAPSSTLEVNKIKGDSPAQALETFAFLGRWEDFLQALADMATPEEWDFPNVEKKSFYILKKYIQYTFYRIQLEGKVMLSEDGRLAAFNTGLVDSHFDEIYACFVPNTAGESPWLFKEFCIAGHFGMGKQLVQNFNPLPKPATYFQHQGDLLFDLTQEIHCDYEHILIENIDRFPLSYLKSQFYDHKKAMKLLSDIDRAKDDTQRDNLYGKIQRLLESDSLLYNRLKNRIDDAVLLARKEVRWNYHTAIPSYYPSRNTMNFMLPLHLSSDEAIDIVLVVELTPAGNYQGQTILTRDQAYIDARLVCSLKSHWLDLGSISQ
ncbi:MAG: DUF3825 domain-containing protein [Peptococcaceae bacterium]|nr:DUF3825 domain-containing protein [Peptococcaceae bacterium]